VDIADRHALVPLYSFLTDKGQAYEPFAERLWRRLLACEKGSECRICCQFMPFRGLTAHATLSFAKGSYVIEKIHSERKPSVVVVDEIRQEMGNGTGISRPSSPADSRRYLARPNARRGSNWAKRSEAGSQRPES
jgi:hypothetical protein